MASPRELSDFMIRGTKLGPGSCRKSGGGNSWVDIGARERCSLSGGESISDSVF